MRFALRRSLLVQPLFVLMGGATAGRSYLDLEGDHLHVRFGWFFDNKIALSNIATAQRSKWPWFGGLGLRTNLAGQIAAVGSYGGVVEINLKQKQRTQAILPFIHLNCERLYVSLEQPDAFVAALRAALPAST